MIDANAALRREVEQLQASLERRRLNFQRIVDSIPVPVAVTLPTTEVEGLNQLTLDYFGRSLEELKAWKSSEVVHPDDLERTIAAQAGAHASGQPYNVESRHLRHDGVYRWFNVLGLPLRDGRGRIEQWLHLLIDIDDRRRAQAALATRERDLQATFDYIPALAWSAAPDGSPGSFHYNKHYLDYLGPYGEDVLGAGWRNQFHPDDHAILWDAWYAAVSAKATAEVEARLRRRDGEYRWFLFRIYPLVDEDGRVTRMYGVNTDIHDRRLAERARDRAQAELAYAERMMSLGVLTASITHEVNQPLSGIITNANTCLRMLSADPPNIAGALETARRTIRDGNRAADVIARLRALFGKKEPTSEAVDLNSAALEVIDLARHELSARRISVATRLDDDLPPAIGDRIQLQQVILNLLLNASDALVGVTDRPRRIVVETEGRDATAHLIVRDTGIGIPAEATQQLFDAFYTTKPEGMGIGLSVSRSIVERHDGRLWAEQNEGGVGAAFGFALPGAPGEARA